MTIRSYALSFGHSDPDPSSVAHLSTQDWMLTCDEQDTYVLDFIAIPKLILFFFSLKTTSLLI